MINAKKDVPQIHRSEHDPKSNARRVRMVDTEININLDHKKDSITYHPDKLTVSSMGNTVEDVELVPAMDCSSLKRVSLYIDVKSGLKDCTISLEISPVDSGDVWFSKYTMIGDDTESPIVDVCARRFRVVKMAERGSAEFDLHLVGQG